MSHSIDDMIADVVARDACSGCGACTLLDRGLMMTIDDAGYARPQRVERIADGGQQGLFPQVCPGVRVVAPARARRHRHPTMGPYVAAWAASATDQTVRHRGSSGGALTALSTWLLDTGQVHRVTGAAAGNEDPRTTVPVTIMSREEALAAAGSRYAPVGAASNPDVRSGNTAVIGKPCEIAALRSLSKAVGDETDPLLLSFFCAGTPSGHTTLSLLETLGVSKDVVPDGLWYRGRGWPGEFTAHVDEQVYATSYDVAWGKHLGRTTQWRCKMCVDGVGDSADIVAADYWHTDTRGYPIFEEGDGVSALIARTERGREVIINAIAAGVLEVQPLNLDDLARVQPLQVERRTYLFARLIGSRLARRRPPSYRGYGWWLFTLSVRHPRLALRAARGTWRRVRAQRRLARSVTTSAA